MNLQPGVTRRGEGIDGVHWNIMGQVHSPKSITEDCFSWRALLPPETFVPPHVHRTQDKYIHVLTGALDIVLGDETVQAGRGDLVCMPRGVPHGLFNNTGHDVTCLFWVTPTGRLVNLFRKLHDIARPDEVVATARNHEVDFPPP